MKRLLIAIFLAIAQVFLLQLPAFSRTNTALDKCAQDVARVNSDKILGILKKMDANNASDALQEGFIVYLSKCRADDSVIESPYAYILHVSRNKLLNMMRRETTLGRKTIDIDFGTAEPLLMTPPLQGGGRADPSTALNDLRESIAFDREIAEIQKNDDFKIFLGLANELANDLTERDIRILYRRVIEEKTAAQIAGEEDLPESTVQSSTRKAHRAILRASNVYAARLYREFEEVHDFRTGFWTAMGVTASIIILALFFRRNRDANGNPTATRVQKIRVPAPQAKTRVAR